MMLSGKPFLKVWVGKKKKIGREGEVGGEG